MFPMSAKIVFPPQSS